MQPTCSAILCVLAALVSACGTTVEVSQPFVAPWFELADLPTKRVAVVQLGRSDQDLGEPLARRLGRRLPRSGSVDLAGAHGQLSPEFLTQLRLAGWDYVLAILPLELEYSQHESEESSMRKNKCVTTTSYTSRTQVDTGFSIWRLERPARAFFVQGTAHQSDSESEDDAGGKFPIWLIMALFFSADYPDYPDARQVASDLAEALDATLEPPDRQDPVVPPERATGLGAASAAGASGRTGS